MSANPKTQTPQILELPIGKVRPDPNQPRREIDKGDLQSLVASIKANGVLQPILVRPVDAGAWMIVAGERRWRAAKAAGLETMPCMLQVGDDVAIAAVQLAENMEREDLSDIDVAEFLHELRTKKGASFAEMAKALEERGLGLFNAKGLERWLKLVELPDWAKDMMREGVMSKDAALAVLPANQYAKWSAELGKHMRQVAKRSGRVLARDVQQDLRWSLREIAISLDATYPDNLVRKFPRIDCNACQCLLKLGKEMFCTDRKAFDAKNKAALALEAEKAKDKEERTKGKGTSGRDNPDPTKVQARDVSKFENKHGVVMEVSKGLGRNTFEDLADARFDTATVCRRCPHKHPAALNEDATRGSPHCFHPPCFNANQGKARRDELAADKVGTWLDGWLRPRVLDWAIVDLTVEQIYGVVYWLALAAPGNGPYERRENLSHRSEKTIKAHAILDFPRALEHGADSSQDGAREEGLLRLAIELMETDELRWFAREFVGVKLEADRYGFAIDDAYLQLMRKAQLERLAELGGLSNDVAASKPGVAELRKAILESEGCIQRIGVPVEVRDVFATGPARGNWDDWKFRDFGEDDRKIASGLDAAGLRKAEAVYGKLAGGES